MNRPAITGIVVGAVILLLTVVAGAALRGKARAERERDVAVANVEAALTEQLRTEVGGQATVLRLQLQLEADSLARIAEGRVSAALRAMNDSLGVVVQAITDVNVEFHARMDEFDRALVELTAANPQGAMMRIAAFQEEGPPVEGEIVVEVPVDQSQPIMLTTVLRPTPWTATLQLGCTERNVASFALDAPAWVPASIELGVVDQDVCNPVADLGFAGELLRIDVSKLVWAGAGAGVMLLLTAALGR